MARAISRTSRRGATFVEAIIVCAMLMILCASAVFFHRVYALKLQATREARLAVWQPALAGCPSQLGIGQLFNLVDADNCQNEGCSVGGLDTASDDGPDWLALGAQTSERTHSVTADPLIGGRAYAMQGRNRVICNEERQNERGDLASIGDYILDAVIQ